MSDGNRWQVLTMGFTLRQGFLIATTGIWAGSFIVKGAVMCIVECLVISLASSH